MRLFVLVSVTAAAAALLADDQNAKPNRKKPVTLLGVLGEWQYPGSKLLDGATMCDGGNPGAMPSAFCHAVLTTPDPVEKVVAFYARTETQVPASGAADAQKSAKMTVGACVLVQDDSKGRLTAVKVILINRVDSTTTLVVTRGEKVTATHIAWSHHLRDLGR